jgi:hypothetical protein
MHLQQGAASRPPQQTHYQQQLLRPPSPAHAPARATCIRSYVLRPPAAYYVQIGLKGGDDEAQQQAAVGQDLRCSRRRRKSSTSRPQTSAAGINRWRADNKASSGATNQIRQPWQGPYSMPYEVSNNHSNQPQMLPTQWQGNATTGIINYC